jgi:hypothetical protein
MFFYPTLTDELLETAGFSLTSYIYSYNVNDLDCRLIGKGKNVVKFDDDTWRIERDGLRIRRSIVIEYPEYLYGKSGIACEDAELGICIIWTNKTLKQMGTILPGNTYRNEASSVYEFDYLFEPGTIKGDLCLETQLYIKKAAEKILLGEESLMNDEGVKVGVLDEVHLDLGSMYMEFPIAEINDKKLPMWWLELSDWSEPQKDLFDEDSLCIYLNTAYELCPKMGETVKYADVLIDIITTVYVMLYRKVSDCGCLANTINDVDLEEGSISKILYYFKDSCKTDIDFSTEERMHKTIWMNVADMINGGDD